MRMPYARAFIHPFTRLTPSRLSDSAEKERTERVGRRRLAAVALLVQLDFFFCLGGVSLPLEQSPSLPPVSLQPPRDARWRKDPYDCPLSTHLCNNYVNLDPPHVRKFTSYITLSEFRHTLPPSVCKYPHGSPLSTNGITPDVRIICPDIRDQPQNC